MTDLTVWLSRMSDVVGWSLIHFVWQGAALALLLGLARLLVPRGMARVRYLASCATLGAMLLVPVATAWRLADPSAPASALPAAAPGGAVMAGDPAPPANAASWQAAGLPRGVDPGRIVVDPSGWLPWLVLAWSLGVLVCSVRLAGGWWQARRLVRYGTRPLAGRWQDVLARLSARLELTRAVTLLESARVPVPVVVGWLKPVLLVPTAVLGGLAPQQLEAVIAHELAHVRRHDYLANLLQSVVETLLFYHPAVWWVSRTARVEREHCCDDLAVAACGDAVLYARALTAIESLRAEHTALVVAANGSPLLSRVRRLLGVKPPARVGSSAWAVALLTAVMVSGAGVTSWLRAVPMELAGTPEPVPQAPQAAEPQTAEPPTADQAPDPATVEHEAGDLAWTMPAERAFERAMAAQQRALEAAARAMERAQHAAARHQARQASHQARQMVNEAMRQAREMTRTARRAVHDAARAFEEAHGSDHSWQYWSDGVAPEAPAPPASVVPPAPPVPPVVATPPSVAQPPAPPSVAAQPAVPHPPSPPAVPEPPSPPAPMGRETSHWNVTHTSDGVTLKIDARGRIDFSDDDTDVIAISPGGHFTVERRVGGIGGVFGEVTRFEARQRNGAIERKYLSKGRQLDPDEGRRWLATVLPGILRDLAVNADRRVARQLARGGPALVLAEIGKTRGSFARSVYLRQLYMQTVLEPAVLGQSLQQAASQVDSDFELGQALRVAADRQPIDQALPAFAAAARAIDSDFEQRQTLARAVAREGLSAQSYAALWVAATPAADGRGIASDFELAQLLKQSAAAGRVVDANIQAYLAAAHTVGSDFERRGVVEAVSAAALSDARMAEVVGMAAGIGSDFERAQAIVGLSRRMPAGETTRKALADAARGIGSDFERGRALSALARAGVLPAAQ